jgi:cobalt-zinc-cadmium efflux system outer membrane protein
MKKIIISFLILMGGFFGSTMVLFPQEVTEKKIILVELIREALDRNPQLQATRDAWQASLKAIPQAKSLPDPMLSYSYFGQSIETRLGPQRNKISLSQKLPFFGKLSLKGKIAESTASVFQEHYKAVEAEIVLKVKTAYFSLYWFDKALDINKEEKEVLKRLAKIAEKKYETGDASQQDVLKAQLEISKVTDKILQLEQGRRSVVAQLNALLSRPQDIPLGDTEEISLSEFEINLEELYETARKERPEMKEARYHIERSEINLKLTKKNYFPDLQIMFDYIDIGEGTTSHPDDGRNAWMGSIGINVPLWRQKLRAAEAEAAIRLKATRENYENVENETLSRVNELFFEVKTAQDQMKLYKYSLLPQAEQAMKASEVGYLAGKVDFLSLLDSERMILQLKIGYFKAATDFEKSLAGLERILGKELPRGLDIIDKTSVIGGYQDE